MPIDFTSVTLALSNSKNRLCYGEICSHCDKIKTSAFQDYKIVVRGTNNFHHNRIGSGLHYSQCEIFDSEYWEWRRGKDLLFPPSSFFNTFAPAVHAVSLIYFKLFRGQVMAVIYDGEEVLFPRFSLQNYLGFDDEVKDYHRCHQLVEYKGKLGCTCFKNGKQDRELSKEVDIETIKGAGVVKYETSHGFYNAYITLMADDDRVIFYMLQDKSFNVVKLKKCHRVGEIFPFRSDLETMDLRMPGANIVSSTKHLLDFLS